METPEEREARMDRALKRLGLYHLKDQPDKLEEEIPRAMWRRHLERCRRQSETELHQPKPEEPATLPKASAKRKRHLWLVPPSKSNDAPPRKG